MIIQQQVLAASRQADQETPSRCQTNRVVDCFQHTSRVLAILGQPWAYLGKRAGEGQYSPPGFAPRPMTGSDGQTYTITGVSHDAITNGVLQFDLLGGGNDGPEPLGYPAIPQALEIPPQFHRPGNPPVAYPLNGVVVPPMVVPPAPVLKPRALFYAQLQEINDYYAALEGLQRPGGMVLGDGRADVEALGAWGYNLMIGATVDECKAQIRESDEWKGKHR